MPVLPKQSEDAENVWTSMTTSTSAWNSAGNRRAEDSSNISTTSNSASTGDDSGGATAYCCLPSGCPNFLSDPISLNDLGDAVKVYCNNESCQQGVWMHGDCFRDWEAKVLSYLRSSGRARSWSEKQRVQNLWTKKGYDLAFKACDCKCGRGHLRQDLTYQPGSARKDVEDRKQRKQRKRDRLLSTGSSTGASTMTSRDLASQQPPVTSSVMAVVNSSSNGGGGMMRSQRTHRLSMSSTGSSSSPPSSAGTTPCTPSGHFMPQSAKKNKFDFFADAEQAATGNIFRHRTDLAAFGTLPRHLQNPYHIKTEDDGPHGNDETRCFLLTSLSAQKVTSVSCVVCLASLYVYDKYPLIDGSFFLSPVKYNSDLQVMFEHRLLYLNAICMHCMDGSSAKIRCRKCNTLWSGATLLIGSMYSYDVFSAQPCCEVRLRCNQCHEPVLDLPTMPQVHPRVQGTLPSMPLKYFSDYSRKMKCQRCHTEDYHFVKSLDHVYEISASKDHARLPRI